MTTRSSTKRRPRAKITLERASRLHHFVTLLGFAPMRRDELLARLTIGLRTFYRELELLKRLGIRIRFESRLYRLVGSVEEVEGKLPFPDPELTFQEMKELTLCPSPTAERLALIYGGVVEHTLNKPNPRRKSSKKRSPNTPE